MKGFIEINKAFINVKYIESVVENEYGGYTIWVVGCTQGIVTDLTINEIKQKITKAMKGE